MATNPENPEFEVENPVDPNDPVIAMLNPEQLTQENQALKDKMGTMEAQMAEVMSMLQNMKNGTAVANPGGPSSAIPPPGSGVPLPVYSSGVNGQNPPTVQAYPWGMPFSYVPQMAESNPSGAAGVSQHMGFMPNGAAGGPQVHAPNPSTVVQGGPTSPIPGFVPHPQMTAYQTGNPSQFGGYYYGMNGYPTGHTFENSQPSQQIRGLEERLRAVEGTGFRAKDARELCLVPDLVLPPKFKAPEVDKYRGTGCPESHITMYVRKMGPHANDDKLLIHCFQNSLAGAPLEWYMRLQPADIRCWKDLYEAFLKQYKYNMDMAPDRLQLQHMSKGEKESFKEYAQKWRSLAAQVKPSLMEKEMVQTFLETLPPIYYEKLITSASFNFSDVVILGDRLESALRSGKISNPFASTGSSSNSGGSKKHSSSFPKKKEGETNVISASNPSSSTSPQVMPFSAPASPQSSNDGAKVQNYPSQKRTSFDPIPMPYAELFDHLMSQNLINTRSMKPLQPPFPRNYNANATCSFHENAIGHTVEDCRAFKHVVQDLIDGKWISFKQNSPNTTTNPLPGHQGSATNAIEGSAGQMIRKVEKIRTPLSTINDELCRLGVITRGCCHEHGCADATCVGSCETFKRVLQDLLDRRVVQVGTFVEDEVLTLTSDKNREVAVPAKKERWDTLGEPSGKFDYLVRYDAPESAKIRIEDIQPSGWDEEEEVLTLHSERGIDVRKPVEILYNYSPQSVPPKVQPVVIEVPAPFPYESDKAVPWKYSTLSSAERSPSASIVTNIVGTSGITRSGRVFAPGTLGAETSKDGEQRGRKDKGKEPEVAPETATEKEANEFMKVVRQSDYRIVDQLKHTPSKISMLSLLLSSEAHRNALLKILSEAHVAEDITVNQFDGLVGNIVAANYLTFADDELPTGGKEHNQALHISVKCGEYVLARVLIDNGSSLNVMPKSTMNKLDVDCSYMRPSSTLVRAFDGSKKEVLGEMEFPMQIGPEVFYINFQIMDINSSYSCLLGRPWIHMAGAIPSSLHQRVKFVVDNKVVVVFGEEETLVNKPSEFKYVEAAEESLETAFQSLEIANAVFGKTQKEEPVARIMLDQGYKVGSGLGRSGQGIVVPIQLKENRDRCGLGYNPSMAERKRMAEERRGKWLAKAKGQDPWPQKIPIYDIRQSFVSAGLLDHDHIAVIGDGSEAEEGGTGLVRRRLAGEELKNWEAAAFPVMFNSM